MYKKAPAVLPTEGTTTVAPGKKSKGFHTVLKVLKGDTYLVMADPAYQLEDEFAGNYYSLQQSGKIVLQPPYEPKQLQYLCTRNNVLLQCIEVMVVNIDGTGFEFVPIDEDTQAVDPAELTLLQSFFNEPYPGMSFISMRKLLRRDIESIGYGFLEVIRNVTDDIVGVRNVVGHATRFIKLDAPVQVERSITRAGKEVTMTLYERERRFTQRVWGAKDTFIYYKEFGSTRDVNRFTGQWVNEGDPPLAPKDKATELICFGVIPDVETPYYVPRWINQLPSVVGSRKAEEANLEYFDAGGLPPAIVFVQGGTLAGDVSEQLKLYLSGQTKNRNRAVIVEAQSSSGSLEAAGQVKVTVERFGAEKANDAMFLTYDKQTGDHTRTAFRFPDLFLGLNESANFATAITSYAVAEAQVFAPERTEFDERINKTIINALGIKTGKMRSIPITLKNVEIQLQGIGLVETMVDPQELVKEIAGITGISLKYHAQTAQVNALGGPQAAQSRQDNSDAGLMPNGAMPPSKDGKPVDPKTGKPLWGVRKPAPAASAAPQEGAGNQNPNAKAVGLSLPGAKIKPQEGVNRLASFKTAKELFDLVQDYAVMYKLTPGVARKTEKLAPSRQEEVMEMVGKLEGEQEEVFYQMLAAFTLGNADAAELVHEH